MLGALECGERRRGSVRCGDGVLAVPGARGSSVAVLGALEYGERWRGFVWCSESVLAGPGGCAKCREPAWGRALAGAPL